MNDSMSATLEAAPTQVKKAIGRDFPWVIQGVAGPKKYILLAVEAFRRVILFFSPNYAAQTFSQQ